MDWKQYLPKQPLPLKGKWIKNWFSNMVESPFTVNGDTYNSVENYYQAHKATNATDHSMIATAAPSKSKQLGRKIVIRADWESIKYDIMKRGLIFKFNLEPFKSQLLATGNEMIIEWNNWNDKIWGVSIKDYEGQNLLGKALMEIRTQLNIDDKFYSSWECPSSPSGKCEYSEYDTAEDCCLFCGQPDERK